MVKLPGNNLKARFPEGTLMATFEELAKQYESMIWKVIHSLHIYKNQEEYFHTGLIALWEANQRFVEGKGSFSGYAYFLY